MNPKKLVDEIEHLVSLPDVCVKVNRLVDSPSYSARSVGEIVSRDTDLSARLLRLVNSSFLGLRAPVDTISRAIAVIGTNELRNLVMATTAARVFTGIPSDLVNMYDYWSHAVTTGVIGRELAVRCNVLHSERLFVMGMLHDIGRLVIYLTLAEKSRDILLITGGDDWLLPETERDVLGFDHMDVGAELLRKWNLPDGLVAVVGGHHDPMKAGDFRFEAALVCTAIALANREVTGESLETTVVGIAAPVWEITGLSHEDLESITEGITTKVHEVMELILSPSAVSHKSSKP
ncbi:MAG: HDOD domain-containing protein [Gammaproteobacteria bacterium]|nr:HDOD domain-containing protein [Gammaproteobacteria bacterium]